jgi:predicted dehydrogenase
MAISRRTFVAAPAAFAVLPRSVLGGGGAPAPSDRVTAACIGVGSQGLRVMMDFLKEPDLQVVAVCDVNKGRGDYVEWWHNELRDKVRNLIGEPGWGGNPAEYVGGAAGLDPARYVVDAYYRKRDGAAKGCATYTDFRELLAKEKDIDAVIIGTPDHLHAPVAVAAMRAGKHVFCQKPMSHSIPEARKMAEVARQTGVATQVAIGNQASEDTRRLCEWVWDGAIGPVREVINWSSRPFWPQGIARPSESQSPPPELDWDLWLGPAPNRPYNNAYQPFVWRGWHDFGCGALGDMACYSFDTIFRVLKLGPPESVEASSSELFAETFPKAEIIHFYFPARGQMPPVHLTWYDGGLRPPQPEGLAPTVAFDKEGLLFAGDRGSILCEFDGAKPRIIPEARMNAYQQPPKTLLRSPGNYREWIDAAKGGKPGGANFEFEALVTESLLAGNIAVRTREKLAWDGGSLKFTNSAAANELLQRPYREGWTL